MIIEGIAFYYLPHKSDLILAKFVIVSLLEHAVLACLNIFIEKFLSKLIEFFIELLRTLTSWLDWCKGLIVVIVGLLGDRLRILFFYNDGVSSQLAEISNVLDIGFWYFNAITNDLLNEFSNVLI